MLFVSAAVYTYVTRLIYKNVTWPFDASWKWYVMFIPNFMLIDYLVAPFNLLTWADGMRYIRGWNYWGHVLLVLLLAVFVVIDVARTTRPK